MSCEQCLSIGDMGSCQNFKSPLFGCIVTNDSSCGEFERDGDK